MPSTCLIVPMAAHVLWTTLLYVALTVARAPVAWGLGQKPDGTNPWSRPERRIGANLRNQFEWPVYFHVACAILIALSSEVTAVVAGLAWIFVVGRILHSCVQIMSDNVRWRGVVFTINFVAVLGMWFYLVMTTFSPA